MPSNVKSVIATPSTGAPDEPVSQNLRSLIISLGEKPSVNISSILNFGPRLLGCSRLDYTDFSEESILPTSPDSKSIQITLPNGKKNITFHDVYGELNPENLKVFIALLTEQERRKRDIVRTKSLKDYTKILFDACPDGLIITDKTGTIINTNRAMVSMSRKPMTSLIGLKISQLVDKEARSTAFQALRKLTKQPCSRFDCRMKIGAGRSIPTSVCFSDLIFQEQQLILATVRDLSYLEEEVLQCNTYEQSMAHSVENATDGFIRYDQFGRITEANPYIQKLTGVHAARMMGRPVDDLLSISSLRKFRYAVAQLNETGYASFRCEVNIADGSTIPACATLMQFEVEGERYCRMILQDRRSWDERLRHEHNQPLS